MIALIVGLAAAAEFIAPYPYDEMNILVRLKPPSTVHWFGTDEYGRDVLSRTLIGARPTLIMGFGATAFSLLIGVPLGLVAGYRRGRVDEAIMRTTDVLMSFPPILLGLLVLAVSTPALWKAMLAVGVVYIPPIVRLARSVTLDIAQEEFVLAAQARGDSAWYILIAEILPNAWPPISV
jgi:peptide/nickel transport system permease protein